MKLTVEFFIDKQWLLQRLLPCPKHSSQVSATSGALETVLVNTASEAGVDGTTEVMYYVISIPLLLALLPVGD